MDWVPHIIVHRRSPRHGKKTAFDIVCSSHSEQADVFGLPPTTVGLNSYDQKANFERHFEFEKQDEEALKEGARYHCSRLRVWLGGCRSGQAVKGPMLVKVIHYAIH